MRAILTAAALCCATTTAQAAPLNGDFSAGLNGYTLDACGLTCGRPTDPFLSIAFDGANPYLRVSTSTSLLGVLQASAQTDIDVTASANRLTFDAVRFPTLPDSGSTGASPFDDALSVVVMDAALSIYFLFDILATGFEFNPFGSSAFTTTQTAASDAFFDTGVSVDLSAFEGQTLSLGIFAFSESDGEILTGGFDNFVLSGTPAAAIPLPAGLPLLLGALGIVGLIRRRAGT